MQKFVVLEKQVGQTPLECAESWRATALSRSELSSTTGKSPALLNAPLAYAGRLDPLASGKLLVLIGEECKRQEHYHGLDKEYDFEVLFGVSSDSGDVLGLITECAAPPLAATQLHKITKDLVGEVTFPYPKFSSKTVRGKPLHTWTLEGRLSEIEIPTYTSRVYGLKLLETYTLTRQDVFQQASNKIESIPPVTDERKAIGNDFRRPDVRRTWHAFKENRNSTDEFFVAKFSCICASGTYMRTLAEEIAKKLGTCGLAFSIHRTKIGTYQPLPLGFGFWKKQF